MKKERRCSRLVVYIMTLLFMLAVIPSVKATEVKAAATDIKSVRIKAQVSSSATNAIKIKWNKTSLATGYVIYRKEPTDKSYKRLKVVKANKSSYTDKNLTSSKVYHYAVRAYRKINKKNYYSKYTPVAIATRPTKTTVTAKAASNGKVTVSWKAVARVDGYRIYRKLKGGSWGIINVAKANATSYVDTSAKGGQKYYYCVRPNKAAGGKNYMSVMCNSKLVTVPKVATTTTTYGKLTAAQKEVMKKIIYAVETSGQVYGKQAYDDFTEAYTNSSAEHAITIGAGQWYGTEALRLLKLIRATSPETFTKYDYKNWVYKDMCKQDWSTYKLDKEWRRAVNIQKIISSPAGIKCQDQLMIEQIEEYEAEIRKLGITEPKAVCMFINIRHQGGYGAVTRVLAKTATPVTLDNIYKALQTDTGNQVGAYKTRQSKIYSWLNTYM